MRIRDADPTDAEQVAKVARASWHAAYDGLLGKDTVDAVVDEWYDPASLQQELREPTDADVTFLVAEAPDIVGFANAGATRGDESDPEAADAFLSRLYVHPDGWGEGVGTALTARVARELSVNGYERVWLEVFAANERARDFYESFGFEQIGSATEHFGGTDVTTTYLATDVPDLVKATEDGA